MGRLSPTPYIGRFAPSPSGALHFGSLLAALASFLDARAHQGSWLVRMEDIDPAREPPGAADLILRTLDAFQLHWDGAVLYQSQRLEAYQQALEQLRQQDLIYRCNCPRQRIQALRGIYDGHCRHHRPPGSDTCSIRIKVPDQQWGFDDRILGKYQQHLLRDSGDFVLHRRDALPAYQLAVVVDDAWQGITDVVRGSDLLDSTPRQLYLQTTLGLPAPRYAHIPVASNSQGLKLSKQNMARPLDPAQAPEAMHQALTFLGQQPAGRLKKEPVGTQLDWAIRHWDIQQVPKLANIPVEPVLE